MTTYDLDTATLRLIGEEDAPEVRAELSPGFLMSYNAAYARLVRDRVRPRATAEAVLLADGAALCGGYAPGCGILDLNAVDGAAALLAVTRGAQALPVARLGSGKWAVGGTAAGEGVRVEYVREAPALLGGADPQAEHSEPDLLPEGAQMALAHWAAYVYLSAARRYAAASAQLELYRAAAQDAPRGAAPELDRLTGLYGGA